jgi:putative transposon-encoded protein
VSEDKFKQKNTETLASVQFEGYEVLEKIVKSSGNSGRVYLPTSWIGTKVKIVRVTPKSNPSSDD